MNKLFFLVIVGFLALQNVESRNTPVDRRTGKANAVAEESIGQTITSKTQELLKKADEIAEGTLPDSKQIIAKVEETGQNLVNGIKSLNDLIKKTLKDNQGTLDSNLKSISDNLKIAKDDLEKKVLGADGTKKTQEIRDAVKKGIQDAATQIGKLGEALQPEAEKVKNDLLAGAKIFLDNAEKFTSDLKTQVDSAKPKN